MARFQLISGSERRRPGARSRSGRWLDGFAPGAVVAEVARRADVCARQIYGRRQELRGAGVGFAEVVVRAACDQSVVAGRRSSLSSPGGLPAHPAVGAVRAGGGGTGAAVVIPVHQACWVWLAVGHTDMRKGMNSQALRVQEALGRDPHAGDLYVFRGKAGHLIKVLWHDGIGMSLYARPLECGRFIWASRTK